MVFGLIAKHVVGVEYWISCPTASYHLVVVAPGQVGEIDSRAYEHVQCKSLQR